MVRTGRLLTHVQQALLSASAINAVEGSPRPVELSGEYRTVSKHEEAKVHADLALIVRIDVHGELRARYGDLVQVKKTQHVSLDPGISTPQSESGRSTSHNCGGSST